MVGWFHVSPLQLSSHCRLCWSNTTWETQTGLDLNVNAYTSLLNVSVKADCGQLAVRKDEPGLPTGSFNASVSVGASPRCRVTLSVTAAGAGLNKWSRSSKRRRITEQSARGRVPHAPGKLQAVLHVWVDIVAGWRLKRNWTVLVQVSAVVAD